MSAILLSLLLAYGSAFCAGFEEGFAAGYCGEDMVCVPPPPPACPPAPPGMDSFQGGYSVGFRQGMASR